MATLTTSYQKIKEVYLGNTGYGNVYLRNYAKYNQQDITNNKTQVSVQMRIYTEGGYWLQQSGGYWAIGLTDNTSISGQANQRFEVGETTINTLTGWVNHNSDGTKTNCACACEVNFVEWGWSNNANTTVSLPTIQQKSTFGSGSTVTIQNNGTIDIVPIFTKNVSSYYQTLNIKDTSNSTTLFTFSGVSSGSHYYPNESQRQQMYNYIGTSDRYVFSLVLNTYTSNGGSLVGSDLIKKVAILPTYSITGSVSSVEDTVTTYNTYKGTGNANKIYIAGLSKPKFTLTTVSSTNTFYGRSVSYKLGNTAISNPYTDNNYTGQSYSFTAIDGRKTSTFSPSSSIFVQVPYFKPTLTTSVTRPTPTGSTVSVSISGSYYDGNGLTNLRTPTAVLTYIEQGGSQQQVNITLSTSTSNHKVSFTGSTTLSDMDYQKSVTWNVTLTDRINITATNSNTLPQGLPVWNAYRKNNKNYMHINGNFSADETDVLPMAGITAKVNTNGFNANNLTSSGFYQVATSLQTYSNLPSNFSYGILIVLAQTGGNSGAFQATQIAINTGGQLYIRSRVNNNWSAWKTYTNT